MTPPCVPLKLVPFVHIMSSKAPPFSALPTARGASVKAGVACVVLTTDE